MLATAASLADSWRLSRSSPLPSAPLSPGSAPGLTSQTLSPPPRLLLFPATTNKRKHSNSRPQNARGQKVACGWRRRGTTERDPSPERTPSPRQIGNARHRHQDPRHQCFRPGPLRRSALWVRVRALAVGPKDRQLGSIRRSSRHHGCCSCRHSQLLLLPRKKVSKCTRQRQARSYHKAMVHLLVSAQDQASVWKDSLPMLPLGATSIVLQDRSTWGGAECSLTLLSSSGAVGGRVAVLPRASRGSLASSWWWLVCMKKIERTAKKAHVAHNYNCTSPKICS
mmetsp:Transcript_15297/g.30675  ORF Transcript_15297/g.30675 Transcript_15297/m.30675 type:complete len:282 (+) Transcript_15297:93-938(+)